jgi:hypothetical protein
MNDAIDERVFEASVLAALNRVRAEQDAFPDPCVAIQQELSLIEAQSQRLLDLMGDGKGSAFMVQELDGLAARQAQLQHELQRLDAQTQVLQLEPTGLHKSFDSGYVNLPDLICRHVLQASQMLR